MRLVSGEFSERFGSRPVNQMLEHQLALERQQGYRGPATRLIGPIESMDDASLVVRECSLALIALGIFQIFLTIDSDGDPSVSAS